METLKRTMPILIIAIVVMLSLCLGQATNEPAKKHECVSWVQKCLRDFESVKVGMTRAEIEKKLPMDGGIHLIHLVRFVHPECRYFKIDVEFDVKKNDKGDKMQSPDDYAKTISKPYIETPF